MEINFFILKSEKNYLKNYIKSSTFALCVEKVGEKKKKKKKFFVLFLFSREE